MRTIISINLALFLGWTSTACQSEETAHDNHAHHHQNAESLIAENEVSVGSLEKIQLESSFNTLGTIEVPPQNGAELYPLHHGNLEEIHVIKGQPVEAGEVLAQIAHPDLQNLQEAYRSAEAHLREKQQVKERQARLRAEEAIAPAEYQSALANYQNSLSQRNQLAHQLISLGLDTARIQKGGYYRAYQLRAPFQGNVTDVLAHKGAFLERGQAVLRLINDEHLHLELAISPGKVDQAQVGSPVRFRTLGTPKVFEGEIYQMSASADADGFFTAHVHFHPEATATLKPGKFVEAKVITAADSVWALPSSALWEGNKVKVLKDSLIEEVPVKIGRRNKDWFAIKNPEKLRGKKILMHRIKYISEEAKTGHSH